MHYRRHHPSSSSSPSSPKQEKTGRRRKRSIVWHFFFPQHKRNSTSELPVLETSAEQKAAIASLADYGDRHLSLSLDHDIYRSILESTHWDNTSAIVELIDFQEADQRLLAPPPLPGTVLLGCENDRTTSCYIDALLFAMYIGLDAFDPLLTYDVSNDDIKQRLQMLLRLVINKMRKGHLVRTNLVHHLRMELKKTSWAGSENDCWTQEDASEFFMFLTDTFDLPYLPFQIRLFHGGSRDADDDRVMTDRMLAISVDDTSLNPLRLESMLLDHFYNSIVTGIRRHVDGHEADDDHRTETDISPPDSPTSPSESLKHMHIEDATGRYRQEVPVTAWQVLELLPFYSGTNEQGKAVNAQIQGHFPGDFHLILPIVLKRYTFDGRGLRKVKRRVQIPPLIHFNQFINRNADNLICATCGQTAECLLQLRSAVCHLGDSPHAGHYVAYARLDDPAGDAVWLKLDDMRLEERVKVLTEREFESVYDELGRNAYILFYELSSTCHHENDESDEGGGMPNKKGFEPDVKQPSELSDHGAETFPALSDAVTEDSVKAYATPDADNGDDTNNGDDEHHTKIPCKFA